MSTDVHGPAGPATYVPEKGWVRSCKCGRTFVSVQGWEHVPALYDHLYLMGWRSAGERTAAA